MSSRLLIKIIFVLITLIGLTSIAQAAIDASPAVARALSNIPNTFDAGVIQNQLQQITVKKPPKTSPSITSQPLAASPIKGGEKIHFKLTKVIFTGNTVFTDQQLQAIFAPSMNKEISITDVENLVQQISVKYRSEGYILSRAILPAQQIEHGVLKIEIAEGYISHVTVTGDPGRDKCIIEAHGQRIMQSKPLKISVLEHEMLLLNDVPGLVVKAVIVPSKTTPDAADLTLVTERHAASAYVTYDDYGTRFIGPLETSLGVSANSLILPGDTTTAHFTVTSKESELIYGDISNTQLLGTSGLNISLGGNYTQTQPLFTLTPLNVIGRSASIYSNLMYPLIRSRSQNLQLHALANYENVTSTILDVPFYQDRFRSLALGFAYNGSDSWNGSNTATFDFEHGFDILGADEHALQSRPRGRSDYTRAMASASRIQPIYGPLSFYISSSGQYAFNPLLATTQFSFGGPIYGRGYGPAEILGDRGVDAKAELRIDQIPEKRFLQAIEYYVFYDAGVVWNLDTFDLPAKQSATSTGFGMRVNFMPQISGEVYLAKPLTRQDFTLTPPDQNPQQARVFFQLIARL